MSEKVVKKEWNPAKLNRMEGRLVDFEKEYDRIMLKWAGKKLAAEGTNDAYIFEHILCILGEPDMKVAQKRLTARVLAVKLPMFRSYYKDAREDIKRLRVIAKSHRDVAKEKEKRDR